ncbi:MAG: nitrous oxide reductase accessory protein NosL [Phycisphaerales bacterium]|nr:nitrous oxide reductase accessory protein NosL [Phycisphaerales bacterium]
MKCMAVMMLSAACGLCGCGRTELAGPPTIRLGKDECVSCGMIISEGKCSGAMLIETAGDRAHLLFDDLGCLLDYKREQAGKVRVVGIFVHDFGDGGWVESNTATYVFGAEGRVHTPMGSGIIAFGSRERAEARQRESGGELMAFAALAEARRDWMEQRFGKAAKAR